MPFLPPNQQRQSTEGIKACDNTRIFIQLCICRASVGASVYPIRPTHSAAAAGLLLWARRPGDIDRLLHGRRSAAAAPQHGRAAANAGSGTLSADVGS